MRKLSFLYKKNIVHIEYLNLLFFCSVGQITIFGEYFIFLPNIFPRNILRLLCCEDKILKGEEMISDGVAPWSRLGR